MKSVFSYDVKKHLFSWIAYVCETQDFEFTRNGINDN